MHALSIVAHPSPDSFSHLMACVAGEVLTGLGIEVRFHDLYAEAFDPVQRVTESANTTSDDALIEVHCTDLREADLIMVFHPNWWSQPPAILKGWIDRVWRLDTAYGYPQGTGLDGVPRGLLRARAGLVFNTSNTPVERETEVFGDPLQGIWKRSVFELCGITKFVRRMYGPMASASTAQRDQWLAEVQHIVRQCYAD
jgi:putative NADPH-quinone reductase